MPVLGLIFGAIFATNNRNTHSGLIAKHEIGVITTDSGIISQVMRSARSSLDYIYLNGNTVLHVSRSILTMADPASGENVDHDCNGGQAYSKGKSRRHLGASWQFTGPTQETSQFLKA
jgi:hypothetical protein